MSQIEQEETPNATLNLKEYFHILLAWSWLIVLAGLIAAGTAYLISLSTTPTYEASAKLLISDPPAMRSLDYSAMVNASTMTRTYSEMLADRPVLQGVIDELKLNISPDELKKSIVVELVRDTQLAIVTVQSHDPQQAAAIANAMAAIFADRIRALQSERYSASESGLSRQIADMEAQIGDTNSALARETDPYKALQLETRLTEYRQLYSNLVTNYEQVHLAEAQTSTNIVVSEPAIAPSVPVSPRTTRNIVIAALAGILLAFIAVLLIDTLDDTLKNPDEIRHKFNLPILGIILHQKSNTDSPITLSQSYTPGAEMYRALRATVNSMTADSSARRILVTSAIPHDGKTTVASNLAVAMAQGEKKTLLLDADLRHPHVHRIFGLQNQIGLSSLFENQAASFYKVARAANQPGLTIITSGKSPINPGELLASTKMTAILNQARNDFDVIVIDTPPVLAVADVVSLLQNVDGVILVAKPGETKVGPFGQAVEQLRATGARILGVVLNDVNPRNLQYGHYFNHYSARYENYYAAGMQPALSGSAKKN